MFGLGAIVKVLEAYPDKSRRVPVGFGVPTSYRGYYEDLAFPPEHDVSVAVMLERARGAIGRTFTGYKGGEYEMNEWSQCWMSRVGHADGDAIGPIFMSYMLDWPLEQVLRVWDA